MLYSCHITQSVIPRESEVTTSVQMASAPNPLPTSAASALTTVEMAAYARDGFHVARGLVDPARIDALRAHFMALHALGGVPGRYDESERLLAQYPRMMQPHRWDDLAKRQMLDAGAISVMRDLMQDEPVAVQSMFYYKQPGSEGQGFHQDNFYLKSRPSTCMAAWLAVDDADAGNGGLYVLPGSHVGDIVCPESGGVNEWGTIQWQPDPKKLVEVKLRSGDCLFFNGSLVHGSQKNESTTRWRRSFICHYIGRDRSDEVGEYYAPLFATDGTPVTKRLVPGAASPCGGRML